MVEGARLESVCRRKLTVGSNPTLSAMPIIGDTIQRTQKNRRVDMAVVRLCYSGLLNPLRLYQYNIIGGCQAMSLNAR